MPESQHKHVESVLDSWWDGYREKLSAGGTHRVETFVRSWKPAPGTHSHRAQLFKTLEQQAESNNIEEYDVTFLGGELCLCDSCRKLQPNTAVLDTIKRLESWRDGGICASGFESYEISSSLTNEEYRVIVPPEIALGIYVDDSLTGVFPCMVEGVNFNPQTYADAIENGKLDGVLD